ncbi:MAG: DinB family protein [Saprospiraceae bacterium]|nr:DinB family protein [Saprospiraceae bacterium]
MKPTDKEYGAFYAGYIARVQEHKSFDQQLRENMDTTLSLLASSKNIDNNYRYAKGKWSIKEVIQHIVDTERIMIYRALRIARGDKTSLPGFEQDDYVDVLDLENVPMNEILDEYKTVRHASISFIKRCGPKALLRIGQADNRPISVRAIACILIGHELHHIQVLEERYLSSL